MYVLLPHTVATVVFTQIAYTVDVNDDIVLVGVALTSDTFLDPDLAIIIFISVTFEGQVECIQTLTYSNIRCA